VWLPVFIGPPHLVRKNPRATGAENRQRDFAKIEWYFRVRLPGNPFFALSLPVRSEGFRRVPGELLLGPDHRGGADLTAHRRIH